MKKKTKKRVKKSLTLKGRSTGRSKKSLKKDLSKKAKKAGWRTSASGRKYYEDRPEKSDLQPKRYKKIP
jgi:hypothetical protein